MPINPQPHTVNRKGLGYFQVACADLYSSIEVIPQSTDGSTDYGIDQFIQISEDKVVTGEFYVVQIKSKTRLPRDKQGQPYIYLSEKHAAYLLEDVDCGATIVAIDVTTGEVFWHATQSDITLVNKLADVRSGKKKRIVVKFDKDKILNTTLVDFANYLRQATIQRQLSKVNSKTKSFTPKNSLEIARSLTESTISLGNSGYEVVHGDIDPRRPDLVMSATKPDGSKYHIVAKQPKDPLNIKFRLRYKVTDDNANKEVEQFKALIDGEADHAEISGNILDLFATALGDEILDEMAGFSKKGKLSIKLNKQKRQIYLVNPYTAEEVEVTVQSWVSSKGIITTETDEDAQEPLKIKMTVDSKSNEGKFNYQLRQDKLPDANTAYYYNKFILGLTNKIEFYAFINGIKRKITESSFELPILTDKEKWLLGMLRKACEVQDITGVILPNLFTANFDSTELQHMVYLHSLLTKGSYKFAGTITTKFAKPLDLPHDGKVFRSIGDASFQVLGQMVNLEGKQVIMEGTMTEVRVEDLGEDIKVTFTVKDGQAKLETI